MNRLQTFHPLPLSPYFAFLKYFLEGFAKSTVSPTYTPSMSLYWYHTWPWYGSHAHRLYIKDKQPTSLNISILTAFFFFACLPFYFPSDMEVTTSEQSWSAILYMFGTYSKSFHDIYFKAISHVGWCLPFLYTLQGFLLQRFSGCYTSLHLSLLGMTPPGFGLFLPSWCCQHSGIHVTIFTSDSSHIPCLSFYLLISSTICF